MQTAHSRGDEASPPTLRPTTPKLLNRRTQPPRRGRHLSPLHLPQPHIPRSILVGLHNLVMVNLAQNRHSPCPLPFHRSIRMSLHNKITVNLSPDKKTPEPLSQFGCSHAIRNFTVPAAALPSTRRRPSWRPAPCRPCTAGTAPQRACARTPETHPRPAPPRRR